jgi:hypothetical protein
MSISWSTSPQLFKLYELILPEREEILPKFQLIGSEDLPGSLDKHLVGARKTRLTISTALGVVFPCSCRSLFRYTHALHQKGRNFNTSFLSPFLPCM